MTGSSGRHDHIHRSRPCLKQTLCGTRQRSSRGADIVQKKDTQACRFWRCRKRLTKLLSLLPIQRGLRDGSCLTPQDIVSHRNPQDFRHRTRHFKALIETAFPQTNRMERKRHHDIGNQARRIMFRAYLSQKQSQTMETVETAAEFPAHDEFPKLTFVNAVKEKLVPRRELLQTFAARHDWCIAQRGRFTAMRAVPSLPALERRQAERTEKLFRRTALPRNERFAAGCTAPFLQHKERSQHGNGLVENGTDMRTNDLCSVNAHRESPPKTRAA